MCEEGNTKGSAAQNNHLFFQKNGAHSWSCDCSQCPSGFPYILVSAPRSPRICFMPNRWGKSSSHLGASAEMRRPSPLSSSIESDVGLPGTFSWIFFVAYLFECSQCSTSPGRHNFGNKKEKDLKIYIKNSWQWAPLSTRRHRKQIKISAFPHAHDGTCLTETRGSIVFLFQHAGLENVVVEWSGDFLKRCDKPILCYRLAYRTGDNSIICMSDHSNCSHPKRIKGSVKNLSNCHRGWGGVEYTCCPNMKSRRVYYAFFFLSKIGKRCVSEKITLPDSKVSHSRLM